MANSSDEPTSMFTEPVAGGLINPWNILAIIIAVAIVSFVIIFCLDALKGNIKYECERQFADCVKNNGTQGFTECYCSSISIIFGGSCKKCYESSGDYCTYKNGTTVLCRYNISD